MTPDQLLEDEAKRPIWLITLADVMLLLVGFFVFLQANTKFDATQIAGAMREGFGMAAEAPMAVDANVVSGFAPGSAALPPADIGGWVRATVQDPRTEIRVAGGTDGSPADVDPATGSAVILAADRARAVAARIAAEAPGARIAIETRPGAGRAVQLTLGFAGETP
ncbi:flagellar motor protein MotB [Sphingomonas sp.]|uniref:flagellar motor protein MotB n=1 Tax=Sphingomonas sp. TaxID=28214 RepID=UPI002DD61B71|nr:flagellar motor protein MotB [Sphingomonas sp.]